MTTTIEQIKHAVPPLFGVGGAQVVGWPWWAVAAMLVLFYGAKPVHDWIGVWRYARGVPGIDERTEPPRLDPPTRPE